MSELTISLNQWLNLLETCEIIKIPRKQWHQTDKNSDISEIIKLPSNHYQVGDFDFHVSQAVGSNGERAGALLTFKTTNDALLFKLTHL